MQSAVKSIWTGAAAGAAAGGAIGLAGGGIGAPIGAALGAGVGAVSAAFDQMDTRADAFWAERKKMVSLLRGAGATDEEVRRFSLQANQLGWDDFDQLTAIARGELQKVKGRVSARAMETTQILSAQVNLFDILGQTETRGLSA